jgi:spermidine synthase
MMEEWTEEYIGPGEKHCHKIKEYLFRDHGQYHKLDIVETENYGRGLFLDGRIQHVAYDEYIYSEAIIHPITLMLGPSCERVLLVGGGPGGAARELLKYKFISSVTQVEIDSSIIELTKKYFPHIADNYHDDPRVKIVVADIQDYITHSTDKFDLIIYDVSEPLENSPAAGLFENHLLSHFKDHLSDTGAFVTWAGHIGSSSNQQGLKILENIRSIYPFQSNYLCHTQSYGTSWVFAVGSMQPIVPLQKTIDQIDQEIANYMAKPLRLYDGATHYHMFLLPKDVRSMMRKDSHE